jgi:hypothetical protein
MSSRLTEKSSMPFSDAIEQPLGCLPRQQDKFKNDRMWYRRLTDLCFHFSNSRPLVSTFRGRFQGLFNDRGACLHHLTERVS